MTAAVLCPPVRNRVAAQLARLRAGVQVHIPFIARQVVQAVRDQLSLACAGEIMVERLHLRLRVGLAFAGEVADQLLFLRVNAEHGLAPGQIHGLDVGDVLKLRVAIGMRAHRLFLACLALTQAVLLSSLRTTWRLAGVPMAVRRRLISRRDRLVQSTPWRIGSPAVNSASRVQKF